MMMSAPRERPERPSSGPPGRPPGTGVVDEAPVGVVMVSSLRYGTESASPSRRDCGTRGPMRKNERSDSGEAGLLGWLHETASAEPRRMSRDRSRFLSFRLLPVRSAPSADLLLDLVDVRFDFVAVDFELDSLPSVPRVVGLFEAEPTAVEPQGDQ